MRTKEQIKFETDEKIRLEREKHNLDMEYMKQQHKNEMETMKENLRLIEEQKALYKLEKEVILLDKKNLKSS